MSARTDIDRRIVDHFRVVIRALDRVMLPRLVSLGLTMAQFKALIAVASASPDGISVTALGRELSIGQPSASLIVEQLVRRGYLARRRDPADRRRVLVSMTPEGDELTDELRRGRRSTFASWLDRTNDADAGSLETGLRALAAAAMEVGDPPLD